jgi:hypothetical protein
MRTRGPVKWEIAETLEFCRKLQLALEPVGFGVGLTGSVLTLEGKSAKDIDVVLYPHCLVGPSGETPYPPGLLGVLEAFGLARVRDRSAVTARWRQKGSPDTKWVEEWRYEGKRVDLFFLR